MPRKSITMETPEEEKLARTEKHTSEMEELNAEYELTDNLWKTAMKKGQALPTSVDGQKFINQLDELEKKRDKLSGYMGSDTMTFGSEADIRALETKEARDAAMRSALRSSPYEQAVNMININEPQRRTRQFGNNQTDAMSFLDRRNPELYDTMREAKSDEMLRQALSAQHGGPNALGVTSRSPQSAILSGLSRSGVSGAGQAMAQRSAMEAARLDQLGTAASGVRAQDMQQRAMDQQWEVEKNQLKQRFLQLGFDDQNAEIMSRQGIQKLQLDKQLYDIEQDKRIAAGIGQMAVGGISAADKAGWFNWGSPTSSSVGGGGGALAGAEYGSSTPTGIGPAAG